MGPFSILLRWELTLPPWGRLFASRAQRQAPVTVNYHFGKYFTNPGAESLKPRVAVTTQVTRRLSRDRVQLGHPLLTAHWRIVHANSRQRRVMYNAYLLESETTS